MPFRYCTQCGFKNVYTLNEAKFCAGCGQSLNQATAGNEPQTTNAPHLQSAQANLEESTDIPNISKLEYSESTRISNTSQASKRMTREQIEAETMRECQSARNRPLDD